MNPTSNRGVAPLVAGADRSPVTTRRAWLNQANRVDALSLVAKLAIFALVMAWISSIARWHSLGLASDQMHGTTYYRVVPEDSRIDRMARALSQASFILAGLLSAVDGRRPRIPGLAVFLLVSMLLDCAYWVVTSYKLDEIWSGIIEPTSPAILSMCIGVFAGMDASIWRKLRFLLLAIAYASAAVGIYYTATLTIRGTFEGPTPTVEHLQIAFWFGMGALILKRASRWRDCVIALIPVVLCIPMALLASSRSFTILAVVGLTTGLMVPLWRHGRPATSKLIALGLGVILFLSAAIGLLILAAPDRVEAFQNRLGQDTRSGQYSQFFSQIPVTSLILGLGPSASYAYNDRPKYNYIDNQFLFLLFKFGLPVFLGYVAVVVWPGLWLL